MPEMDQNSIFKIIILVVLLAIFSFVIVHFNVVSCNVFTNTGCDVYYSLVSGGKPQILILHGEEGMGNPEFLFDVLRGPKFSARVNIKSMEIISLPVLTEYQLVIVEKAKEMSNDNFKMFQEYVARGGKLIWVGDAGTTSVKEESDLNYFLTHSQRSTAGEDKFIGPWARVDGDKQVSFDYLLGVNYKGNYCNLIECREKELVGNIDFIDQDEELVKGLSQGLGFYGNFSVVSINNDSYQETLAFLEHGSNLLATPSEEYFWLTKERNNFGKTFPLIVVSGFGGRVVYYAFPPEYVVSDKMPLDKDTGEPIKYWGILENMYYGMLYK